MAEFDILGALEATASTRSEDRCTVQRWLDDIPDDAPGKAELVQVVNGQDKAAPDFRSQQQVWKIVRRLGRKMSENSIGEHRGQRCACFD